MKRLVVKLGTQLVCRDGVFDATVLDEYARAVRELTDDGHAVVLVSSGAVAAGREQLEDSLRGEDEVSRRQVYSAAGQALLVSAWRRALENVALKSAQILATRSDFRDRGHYLNMSRCLEAMLRHGVVPIVNENDTVSVTELMFTDNDELAGLIAAMVGADRLLLLTNVEGVLFEGKLVSEVASGETPRADGSGAPAAFGRGGMASKISVARKASALGVETWIASGVDSTRIAALGAGTDVGTRFAASKRPSSVKRWVASAQGHEKGCAIVNEGAQSALTKPGALASLLPVGVDRIRGDFVKGDIIRIENESGDHIGFGRAQYGASTAKRYLGQRGKRALVHYNYLFLKSEESRV